MKFTDKQKAVYLLSMAKGIGQVKGNKILKSVSNAEKICYDIASIRYELLRCITEADYREICVALSTVDFSQIESECTVKGIKVVCLLDEEYPSSLACYDDAPLMLYCKGDVKLLSKDCFAVVGTRFPTKYGIRVTEEFTASLSDRFCIVSGMARGIDSCAHRRALESGGKTIAVLGCGVDVIYPAENRALYRDIVENGLVISEYLPGEAANAHNFPARNRIISALSRAVLITEAGENSGTMITLNYAIEQGKDVFCVPGSIYNKQSQGCNKSIRACQTRAATDVNDIFDELGLSKTENIKPSELQLDFNEDVIISLLTNNGEMHFDELIQHVDLSVSQLNALLLKMMALGLIIKTKNNYWSI